MLQVAYEHLRAFACCRDKCDLIYQGEGLMHVPVYMAL